MIMSSATPCPAAGMLRAWLSLSFGEWIIYAAELYMRCRCTVQRAWTCGRTCLAAWWNVHARKEWTIVSAYAIRDTAPRGRRLSDRSSDDADSDDDDLDTSSWYSRASTETYVSDDGDDDEERSEEAGRDSETSSLESTDFVALDHRYMMPEQEPETWMAHACAQVPLSWGTAWRLELRVQRGCQKRRVCLPASAASCIHEVFRWPRDVRARPMTKVVVSASLVPRAGTDATPVDVTRRLEKYALMRTLPLYASWLFPMDDMDAVADRWEGVAVRVLSLLGSSSTHVFGWDDDLRALL